MAVVLPNGRNYFTNSLGAPLIGGRVYTYVPGTSTPKATYTDSGGGTPNANPVVLDVRGEAAIYWTGDYDVILKDASDVTIWGPERLNEPEAAGSAAAALADLANTANIVKGDALIGAKSALTGGTARTQHAKNADVLSVKDFGAVGDGATNDTAAIVLAIDAAATLKAELRFPAGTYLVTPATAQTGAASYNCCFVMPSYMHLVGEQGATIKLSNNYSTDGSPKELAIFSISAGVIGEVSFSGLTFDMNGANNLMSPSRPATYNTYNHAAIMANGPSGRMDDVLIENCTFKNNAGVCFIVCQLVAAGTTPALGKRWKIKNNLFINGGIDSADHTSVYGFAEDVLCEGNTFWQDTPPHTVGLTGGATGYEIHGSNQRFVNNYVYNYVNGMYVGPNFTNTTLNSIVAGNTFYTSDYGVLLWRQDGGGVAYLEISGVIIANNTFYFDNYTYSGNPTYKTAIGYQGQIASIQGSINNVKIANNYAVNTGTARMTRFVHWDTSTTAGKLCSNLTISDNVAVGFIEGVKITTNAANSQGYTEISRNKFINFVQDAALNQPVGVRINATGGFKTLTCDANQFIDEAGSPSFAYGYYLENGTITDFYMGPQAYKGLVTSSYTEAGGIAITNWLGPPRDGIATIVYSASMTPDASAGGQQVITATNGTAFTINAPIRPKTGAVFTLTIRNASGGALGAATWDAIYGKSAWTQPANGNSRSITFRYNGTLWIQIAQTGVDVPN